MIEVFNIERTKSLGCFVNFKSAKGTLNGLIASGELSGENPAVLVCSYKNNVIQREYIATYCGKWRVPASPKMPHIAQKVEGVRSKVKNQCCKIYELPMDCFTEAFSDWIGAYQPVI